MTRGSQSKPRRSPSRTPVIPPMVKIATAVLATTSLGARGVYAASGGQFCSDNLCVNAIVNGNQVTYQLKSSLGFESLGWMAVGFGTQMADTPMVVTWPNEDGTITISQRKAPAHVMPTVITGPHDVATLAWENSILATNTTTIAFKYPAPASLAALPMIWAYSTIRPPSSSPDAMLQQHMDMGRFTMDLTKSINALPTGTILTSVVGTSTRMIVPTPTGVSSTGSTGVQAQQNSNLPLTPEQKWIRTHGILMTVGTLVMLPIGVFIARFSRTIPFLKDKWFTAHWIVQLVISGPLIWAGWARGYKFVGQNHFWDSHTKIGLAFLVLYCIQIVWGMIIHFLKPKTKPLPPLSSSTHSSDPEKFSPPPKIHDPTHSPASSTTMPVSTSSPPNHKTIPSALSTEYIPSRGPCENRHQGLAGRPLQNYGHAINGLILIGLAFHNVREGYHVEWEKVFGVSYESSSFLRRINAWWISWVIIIPSVYILGLTLLPRQWTQETDARRKLGQQQGVEPVQLPPRESSA